MSIIDSIRNFAFSRILKPKVFREHGIPGLACLIGGPAIPDAGIISGMMPISFALFIAAIASAPSGCSFAEKNQYLAHITQTAGKNHAE
jgi:hypothetical protein